MASDRRRRNRRRVQAVTGLAGAAAGYGIGHKYLRGGAVRRLAIPALIGAGYGYFIGRDITHRKPAKREFNRKGYAGAVAAGVAYTNSDRAIDRAWKKALRDGKGLREAGKVVNRLAYRRAAVAGLAGYGAVAGGYALKRRLEARRATSAGEAGAGSAAAG